ncbi:ABC transporter substrate-binding protein [Agromyces intestinalis]|uniref:ABC transporter substrate-binding protein n=1 Tax=Agromyces intestinalis TaxID=2592652 RepID=A0A5C1YH15_9MICO|nr:ABC transporter substrate-binding protein [Agromyces intestinalis]QEO14835.1 ABC transporter substrate-binding protein [Agromyces intestinalis]
MTRTASHTRAARTAVPAIAASLLLLAGCAASPAGGADPADARVDDLGTVIVATSGDDYTGGQLAYNVAVSEGYFADEGVTIEDFVTGNAPNTLQALINDQVNIGFLSLSTTAQAVEQGRNVKLAAAVQVTNDWSLIISNAYLESKGIDPEEFEERDIEDRADVLEGTIWATNSAGGLWERASAYLADWFGLDPERDVQLAPLENLNKISGIKDGSVQVWLASAPDNRLLVESGDAVELLSNEELAEEVPLVANARSAETIINDDWASENEELAKAFFRAYQRGADFVTTHSVDEIVTSLEKTFPDIQGERLLATVEVGKGNLPADSRHPVAALEAQIEFALASGNITAKLPIDDVYTEAYLPPATK